MGLYITYPKKITFIHVPKNAGTSIYSWLMDENKNFEYKSIKPKHGTYKEIVSQLDDPGYVFCVVRNPWDRMISYYHYIKEQTLLRIEAIKNGRASRPGKMKWTVDWNEARKIDKSFPEWVKDKNTWGDNLAGTIVSKTQSFFVQDCPNVFKVETLTEDFKTIQTLLDNDTPLSKRNFSTHSNYAGYYDQESIDIVANYYKEDIEKFKYDFK